ncbi:MAG TPA: DUF2683 family protein [Daejeonella sp.]|nr:DUF2683 family protein [Daejeonella sp.]
MDTFIVRPETKAQEKAVKAALEALNVAFERRNEQEEILPPHVLEGIKRGQEQARKGLLTPHEEVMKKYTKYL